MTASCESFISGTFVTYPNKYTESLDSKEQYDPDPESTLRGKFAGLSVWQGFQAIGHLALRINNLITGASFTIGKRKAVDAYLNELKENPTLRGKPISDYRVLTSQLKQLAIDVTMTVLFVVFGVPLRELIALFGIISPLDSRVWYGHLEEFFYSEPKDTWSEKASRFEFFSFSAPCMQAHSTLEKHRRRRCEACCSPETIEYQPKILISRIHILEATIAKARELFLEEENSELLAQLVEKLRGEKRCGVEILREIRLQNGSPPKDDKETKLVQLRKLTDKVITDLNRLINCWALKKELKSDDALDTLIEDYLDS